MELLGEEIAMCILKRPKAIFSAAIVLLLSGCLILPVGIFTENPYTQEKLAPLLQPNADRSLVRQKFGSPAYTKENQRYWFYTNRRETVGIIGGSSSVVLTDDDWLLVEFDQRGKVVFAETRDFNQCTSNGICLDGSDIHGDAQKGLIPPSAPKENECAVYLYLEKLPWPLATGSVRYSINGKTLGTVNSESYLFLTHPQGEIQISAYDLAISTHCEGGKRLYVRAVKKADWSWKTGEDLAPVTADEGEKKIQIRHPSLRD